MKEFNLLGALNSELRKEVIVPREVTIDPNRVTWPYLRCNELKVDTDYTMRVMYSHNERNPLGYVKKSMYQMPYELDMNPKKYAKHQCHYAMVPSCLNPALPDPIKVVLERVYSLVKEKSDLGDDFRAVIASDEELKTFLQVVSKSWTQYIIPVLLYADCDTTKNEAGYDRYLNYTPDKKKKNILYRLLQLNGFAFEKVLMGKLAEKTVDHDDDYIPWNDMEEGTNFKFRHTSKTPKDYLFEKTDVTPLPDEVLEKLAASEDNYPNLVKRELENGLKTPEEMMNLLKSCPQSKKLYRFGLLD